MKPQRSVYQSQDSHAVINWSSPGQNGHHFTNDIFKRIFFNENIRILIRISSQFVPKGPVDNNSALARRQIGDEPLSEPMLTRFIDVYMRHQWGGGGGELTSLIMFVGTRVLEMPRFPFSNPWKFSYIWKIQVDRSISDFICLTDFAANTQLHDSPNFRQF